MDVSSRLSLPPPAHRSDPLWIQALALRAVVLREESWQAEVPQAAETPGSTEMQAQVLGLAPLW